jgi:ribokinase
LRANAAGALTATAAGAAAAPSRDEVDAFLYERGAR